MIVWRDWLLSTSNIGAEHLDLISKILIKSDASKASKKANDDDLWIAKNVDMLTQSTLEDHKRSNAIELKEQAEHKMKMKLYPAQIKQLEQYKSPIYTSI